MEPPGGRDSRFNLGYGMNLLSGETAPDIYGGGAPLRPSPNLQQLSPRGQCPQTARGPLKSDLCYGEGGQLGLEAACHGVDGMADETYGAMQPKKSPPSNGKKTKGRVKIKMEYIENKLRRYTTFSKRKTGIMKKAYELSTLTGTQVMLLVASETGHVYTFATRKLQPMITSEAGKALIQTCLNSPDPPGGSASGGDQRMSATGFEETELTYNISDEDSKVRQQMVYGSPHHHHAHPMSAQAHYAHHLDSGHLGLGGSPQHHGGGGGYGQACPSPLPPPGPPPPGQGQVQGYGHPQHPHAHLAHSHSQR